MLEHHVQLSKQAQGVPPHPDLIMWRWRLRVWFAIWFVSMVFATSFVIFYAVTRIHPIPPGILLLQYISTALILVGGGIFFSCIKPLRRYKRLEVRRQAAVRRERSAVTDPQSTTHVHSFDLPFTVKEPSLEFAPFPVFIVFVIMIGLGIGTVLLLASTAAELEALQAAGLSIVCLVIFLYVIIRSSIDGKERITATDEGLFVDGLWTKKRTILWKDACLFAIHDNPPTFELCSTDEVICWNASKNCQTTNKASDFQSYLREMHDLQLQSFPSFVVGQTGLPLRDLRCSTDKVKKQNRA